MAKVIIIGNGPAGISTALYTTRAGVNTMIIGKDHGALGKATEIENYYGFSQPISGTELISEGIEGARRLGAEIISDEVLGISFNDKLIVITKDGEYEADSVVLATGTSRMTPKIKGLKEYEGHGISYCAVCDAFFYKGKDVAVLGNGNYALHEALELLSTSSSVTILTNGKDPDFPIHPNINIITDVIDSIDGEGVVEKIYFQNSKSINVLGVFVAIGVAGSTDLAKKIGAETQNGRVIVNETMSTNIPGLYAAGDCTGGLLQISKAVYEGAKAGTEIIKYLRDNSKKISA